MPMVGYRRWISRIRLSRASLTKESASAQVAVTGHGCGTLYIGRWRHLGTVYKMHPVGVSLPYPLWLLVALSTRVARERQAPKEREGYVPFLWNSLWMEKLFFLFFFFNRKNSLEEFEFFEFFLKKKRLCASLHKMLRFVTKFGEIIKSPNVRINDSNIIILLTYVKSSLRKF